MLDFGKVKGTQLINKDFVLSKISEAMIFGYYFGNFKIGDKYPSAFRPDRHPSTGFYISKSNKLIYNDLSTGEKCDCFDFVQKLFNCDFQSALDRVATDFGLTGVVAKPMDMKMMKRLAELDTHVKKTYKKIQWYYQKFDKKAIEFFKSYHITSAEVKREGIYQIAKLYIDDWFISNKQNELRFALTIPKKDGNVLTKVYAPENKSDLRFISNIPNDLPFGLHNLRPGPKQLFITKAVKDKIIVQKFFKAVIASQNESPMSINDELLGKFLHYFDEVFVLWDNDEAGLKGMEAMEKRGCKPLHLPITWLERGVKDYSDFSKVRGLNEVELFFKKQKLL